MDKNINDLSHIRKIFINLNLTKEYFNNVDDCKNLIKLYKSFFSQLNEYGFGSLEIMKESSEINGYYLGNPSMIVFNIEYLSYEFVDILKEIINYTRQNLKNKIGCSLCIDNSDIIDKNFFNDLYATNVIIKDVDGNNYEYWNNKLNEFNILTLSYDQDKKEIYGISEYSDSIVVKLIDDIHKNHNEINRNIICPEPMYYMNICVDGFVTPCTFSQLYKDEDYILGNIKNTSILDIYYSEKAEQFREKMRKDNKECPSQCKNCINRYKTYDDIFSIMIM